MATSSTTFKKGQVTNPKGRAPKTDAQREADAILRAGSPRAALKLLELCGSEDDELALKAATALLKMTNGDMVRLPVDDEGKTAKDVDPQEVADRIRLLIAERQAMKGGEK